MTEENLEFSIASDVDFEDLIADIGYKDKLVAILTQEEGFENMRIQIYPPKDCEYWDLRLNDFFNILLAAKKRLGELQKNQ